MVCFCLFVCLFVLFSLTGQKYKSDEGALCEEGEYGESAADLSAGHLRLHVPSSPWQGQLWQGGTDERG